MFLRELFEALPMSTAKQVRSAWDASQYEDLFKKYTDDPKAYRIYLPLVEGEKTTHDPAIQAAVEKEVKAQGFNVTDYAGGYAASDDSQRKIRIGKLIDKPTLLKAFNNDPARQSSKLSGKELMVCISRHPYDVAGMSTDRGWTSCMSLTDGENASYIMQDVTQGTIVAYLIDSNDKNIKTPKGRYAIKVFMNETNPKDWILVREQRAYGSTVPGFKETVDNWLGEVNGDKAEGLYCINPNVYADSAKTNLHTVGKDKLAVLDMIAANPAKYNIHTKIEYTERKDGTIDLTANVFGALLRYLNQYNIKINKLTGNYDCSGLNLATLPVSTPKYIKGNFICADNQNLKKVPANAPLMVSGTVDATYTKLTPSEVRQKITANNYELDEEWD